MKAAVLLFLLVVVAFVSQSDAWFISRRDIDRAGDVARRVGDTIRRGIRRVFGKKRDAEMPSFLEDLNDEELVQVLATRDLSELFDENQLTDAEMSELTNSQREAREILKLADA